MNEESLKVGDIVSIKSGGMNMTIQRILADGQVECVWFDANRDHKTGVFISATLNKSQKGD